MISIVHAAPNVIWSQPLPAGFSEQTGTLIPDRPYVVAGGVVALGSAPCPQYPWGCSKTSDYPSQQSFWVLDANTGRVKWTIPLLNGSVIQPIAAGKYLLAEYRDSKLRIGNNGWTISKTLALDLQTGRIIWSIMRPNSSGEPLFSGNLVIEPDATNPGNWTNPDPTLTAYDASTGSLLWRIHTTPTDNSWGWDYSHSSVGYGGGMIFTIGGLTGWPQSPAPSYSILTAYDASSGSKKWSREWFSSLGGGACPRYMNGILFVKQPLDSTASINRVNLVALNATSSQTLWNKTIGYSWAGSGTPGSSIVFPCQIIGKESLFVMSNTAAYQILPDVVALNPTDGRELWRHSFPCEYDPLNTSSCRPVLWNHLAVSDSMVFMSAGLLYGIDTASGTTTWTYGVTADNWNPLAYVDGVLFAINNPNGFSPTLSALAIMKSAVPEMPLSVSGWVLAAALLGTHVIKGLNSRGSRTHAHQLALLIKAQPTANTVCAESP